MQEEVHTKKVLLKDVVSEQKPLATKTMLTTFLIEGEGGKQLTYCTPTYDIRIQSMNNEVRLILGRTFASLPDFKKCTIAICATDDPNTSYGGGSVSLGYGMLGVIMWDAEREAPHVYNGKIMIDDKEKFMVRMGSPLKEL